ncbi:hypothetical protein A5624_19930 [Mycobacterium sp. 1482292.6]|nr:hypothetical protein A5624_19930 [Mycobacterium sp. 1482292.6]
MSDVRQTYGRLVYTHKTHEKEAERKVTQNLWLTWTNLVVIAVTLAATLAMPVLKNTWAQWIPVGSAVIAFGFATAQLSFQPQREAAEQRNAAKSFLNLRDDFGRLIADAQENADTNTVRARYDVLTARLAELYAYAPQTSGRAYQHARDALAGDEELVFTDVELNRMLPQELRRGGRR